MITRLWLGTRRRGLSRAAFSEHWYRTHGPYGLSLPGLRAYVQNHVTHTAVGATPPAFDGCSELDFDDVAAMRAAFASPEIAAADRDERAFADPDRFGVVVTERDVLFGAEALDTDARLLCCIRASPARRRSEVVATAAEVTVDQAQDAGAVRAELLVALDDVPGPQACDLVVSLWFPTRAAMVDALPAWSAASSDAFAGLAFGRETALVAPRRLR